MAPVEPERNPAENFFQNGVFFGSFAPSNF